MTNTELLAKIKAEIERRYKEFDGKTGDIATASRLAYLDVISFLSTLESEKPMQEELEGEIEMEWDSFNKHLAEYDDDDSDEVIWLNKFSFTDIARHFAQWGAERQKAQDDRLVDIIYQQGIEKGKDEIRETLKREEKNERNTTSGI